MEVGVERGRGEDPLPGPLGRSADVLVGEGARQGSTPEPSRRVLVMEPSHHVEVDRGALDG